MFNTIQIMFGFFVALYGFYDVRNNLPLGSTALILGGLIMLAAIDTFFDMDDAPQAQAGLPDARTWMTVPGTMLPGEFVRSIQDQDSSRMLVEDISSDSIRFSTDALQTVWVDDVLSVWISAGNPGDSVASRRVIVRRVAGRQVYGEFLKHRNQSTFHSTILDAA